MYVYSPEHMLPARIKHAEAILRVVPFKHAFITGSFLYQEEYDDIDLFIITKSKKAYNAGINTEYLDFNATSSVFYHSLTKMCVSKSLLPTQKIRTTMREYYQKVMEAMTPIGGEYDIPKEFRQAITLTIYHQEGRILDSKELKHYHFQTHEAFDTWIIPRAQKIFMKHMKPSYRERFIRDELKFMEGEGFYEPLVKLLEMSRNLPESNQEHTLTSTTTLDKN